MDPVGGEKDMNDQQSLDQRANEMQEGGDRKQTKIQQPQRPQQPQQCPRCNSMNTKFCYYNNYNVAQPRHYCKTCRRYWTQGGTLRNIPIGGGCRKKKHVENSSSSRSEQLQQSRLQDMVVQTQQPNMTTLVGKSTNPLLGMSPSTNPFYQGGAAAAGGGYLSSLHTIHSMNQSRSRFYDQSLKIGNDIAGSSSNLDLASCFNIGSLSNQCQIRPSPLYQIGGIERELQSQYTPQQSSMIPSTMNSIHTSVPTQTDWPNSFINNANNRTCDASLWSTISNSTASICGNIESSVNGVDSTPLTLNQWSDFAGFGPPPSSY
ncbi:hypothetical protein Lal_00041134 [Lupinus albus]|uniref:Putative transcription factor C2C2-Dof family n=1 Tax=Lupinus albus TaxID=3870 RepID=A0A6A5NZR4_LUPAL|nr:putative transcription factor C2C2-Dof family [Lupinus albus]KAF1890418.1 hypothetical protein Lal_00041134 [Lupinus albus]